MSALPARPRLEAGPSRHVYDVIILGGQLGGAVSAALLAKRGYRVLWVEHDGLSEGYAHEGYVLPFAPFVMASPKEMPVLDEALAELGLNNDVQRAMRAHQPGLQLVFPKHRLDLLAEPGRRLTELVREFPEEAEATNQSVTAWAAHHQAADPFFRGVPNLPPNGWWERLGLGRELRGRPELHQGAGLEEPSTVLGLLAELLPFVSYLHQASAPLAKRRPISQVILSSHHLPGGRQGLRELLVRKLQELGGKVLTREGGEFPVVEELLFEGGELKGLKVVGSANEYRASCIIAATDAGALRRLIRDKKRHRKLAESLELASTAEFLFTLNWILPRERLPVGMGDLVLLAADEQQASWPSPGDRPVLIQVSPARRVGAKQEETEEVTVCAGTFVPASTRDLGEEQLELLCTRLAQRLAALMPFAQEAVKLQSAPYLHSSGVRGSRLLPHPLLQVDVRRYLGISGLSPKTPTQHLFLANREVLPGLGLEGEILSGMRAARLVQQALKKSHPLKA